QTLSAAARTMATTAAIETGRAPAHRGSPETVIPTGGSSPTDSGPGTTSGAGTMRPVGVVPAAAARGDAGGATSRGGTRNGASRGSTAGAATFSSGAAGGSSGRLAAGMVSVRSAGAAAFTATGVGRTLGLEIGASGKSPTRRL